MVKILSISQSNYIPWKGYFDLINQADEFILYDDTQYTRRDWRNRNQYKSPKGTEWLSIPVSVKGKYAQHIDETEISDTNWAEKHWLTLARNYSKAPCFAEVESHIKTCYEAAGKETRLSMINYIFINAICTYLGSTTKLSWSSHYDVCGEKNEKLIQLCQAADATRYISGPKAKCYLDESQFNAANLSLGFIDYDGYPEYSQRYGEFNHFVTILDLLFNTGRNATQFMKSFQHEPVV